MNTQGLSPNRSWPKSIFSGSLSVLALSYSLWADAGITLQTVAVIIFLVSFRSVSLSLRQIIAYQETRFELTATDASDVPGLQKFLGTMTFFVEGSGSARVR